MERNSCKKLERNISSSGDEVSLPTINN